VSKIQRVYLQNVGDVNREYRTREEERQWMTTRDPLQTLADRLTTQNLTDQEVLDRILADVKAEIDTGVQFALAAGYPDGSQVDEDVYA
jgi:TPP-dependent pyruvate/acetoin dehydrogenase alpha subunit